MHLGEQGAGDQQLVAWAWSECESLCGGAESLQGASYVRVLGVGPAEEATAECVTPGVRGNSVQAARKGAGEGEHAEGVQALVWARGLSSVQDVWRL